VVITSSKTVTLEPSGNIGPSIHASVPCPFGSLRTIKPSRSLLSKPATTATPETIGSAPRVSPPTAAESLSTCYNNITLARVNPLPFNVTGLQLT